jgi:hypothetical protein
MVQGNWTVRLGDAGDYGSVTCRGAFIRTFRKVFPLLGAEPDDYLALEFNIRAREVLVRIGGVSLLETLLDPQPEVDEADSEQ